jgi:hypothetical protein
MNRMMKEPQEDDEQEQDQAILESIRKVHDLEKNRFSFFDELFALGYVVDR